MSIKAMVAALALTTAGAVPAYAADPASPGATPGATPSAAAVVQVQPYFHAHSYDFATNFRAQHPGPDWILDHAAKFNLTPAQTAKLEKLRDGMHAAVAADSAALKDAYTQYARDGHEIAPAEKTLMKDIQAVGAAQTRLAGAMIPFHLQSYAMLDAAQKQTYDRLVAAGP